MARIKEEFKNAKTCKHAYKVGGFGCVFVKDTCVHPDKKYIKLKNCTVLMAKRCETCTGYEPTGASKQKVSAKKDGVIQNKPIKKTPPKTQKANETKKKTTTRKTATSSKKRTGS